MIYRTPKSLTQRECDRFAEDLNQILESGEDAIIDLKDTEYISSAGLRIIVIYLKVFRAKGYDYSLVNASDFVKNILTVTGLKDILLVSNED